MTKPNITRVWRSVVAVVLLHITGAAAAAQDRETISIDEVTALALDKSPLVAQLEAEEQTRIANGFEIRTLANPELDAELGVPVDWEEERGKNELEVALSQPVRLSDGALRNRFASLLSTAARQKKERELFELLSRVRFIYARSWVLEERARALGEVLSQADSLHAFVARGLEEGAYGKGDDALFRSERAKLKASLKGISAESLAARSELARLTGLELAGKRLLMPDPAPMPSLELLEARLKRADTKVQQRAEILRDVAKAQAAVARRDSFPELRPRLFYSRTDEGKDLVGVGISFALPIFSQNTAERMRAEAEASASRAHWQFTRSEVFHRAILDAARAYRLRSEEVALYEREVLPALRQALTAFDRQLRGGEGSIFELWQTMRDYVDTQERYLELWTGVFSEGVELSILLEEEIQR